MDGKIIWQYNFNEGSIAGMQVKDDKIYIAGLGSKFLCLSTISGRLIWQKNFDGYILSDFSIKNSFIAINFCNYQSLKNSFNGI